ncbi:MAG: hypothetical protein FJ161_01000 [Gammaproteobacteria bacterium]|nr:hypothetical protein [Gammaproteobacteria bacterium]
MDSKESTQKYIKKEAITEEIAAKENNDTESVTGLEDLQKKLNEAPKPSESSGFFGRLRKVFEEAYPSQKAGISIGALGTLTALGLFFVPGMQPIAVGVFAFSMAGAYYANKLKPHFCRC